MAVTLRLFTKCPIVGTILELPTVDLAIRLPTNSDILRHLDFLTFKEFETTKQQPAVDPLISQIAKHVEGIWLKASIDTVVSELRIQRMIRTLHDERRALKKSLNARSQSKLVQSQVTNFKAKLNCLFDIALCKCKCTDQCRCTKGSKVPPLEQEFLLDQRGPRKMTMAGLDYITTKQNLKRSQRQACEIASLAAKRTKLSEVPCSSVNIDDLFPTAEFDIPEPSHVSDFSVSNVNDSHSSYKQVESKANRIPLPLFARACDRRTISDRAAAHLASSLLLDLRNHFASLSLSPSDLIIDRNKVRRERDVIRHQIQETAKSVVENPEGVWGLYFDGRKDSTFIVECNARGIQHPCRRTEEHISMIQEPASLFLGHVTPHSGKAFHIEEAIWEYLDKNSIDVRRLLVIGSDGTSVNTGNKGGVIALLEADLETALQWVICLLHCNELPLKHLIINLDGMSSSPNEFSGPIGKLLQNCHDLPVVSYHPIPGGDFPEYNFTGLNVDQKYLWEICQAVRNGNCPQRLAERKPGKMNLSRWNNTASRILRLYIATKKPTKTLRQLAEYVVKVYAPTWFYIKYQSNILYGSKHLFRLMHSSKYMEVKSRTIIQACIQTNAFFSHPENILLAMLSDDRRKVRELSVERIIKARSNYDNETIRIFEVPTLNFEANDYCDMIFWDNVIVTPPPLLTNYSNESLLQFIENAAKKDLFPFPCHTQAVERCVKLVTEVSSKVSGEDTRDAFIRSVNDDRKQIPKSDSKKDLVRLAEN